MASHTDQLEKMGAHLIDMVQESMEKPPVSEQELARLVAERELSDVRRICGEAFQRIEALKDLVLSVRDDLAAGRNRMAIDRINDEFSSDTTAPVNSPKPYVVTE